MRRICGTRVHLTGRLKSLEKIAGPGGCRVCHGDGGGGVFVVRRGDDEDSESDRACGKMGLPETIIRVVYYDAPPVNDDAV